MWYPIGAIQKEKEIFKCKDNIANKERSQKDGKAEI